MESVFQASGKSILISLALTWLDTQNYHHAISGNAKESGTLPNGTIRFSIGPFNVEEDGRAGVEAVKELAAEVLRKWQKQK